MALSGSQKAYLQARSGIGRSGAIRSGYFLQNVVITITHPFTGVPTDVSAHIKYNGWSISMNLNDDIDTATLSLLPSMPFEPAVRSQVRIALGSADNAQFAGIVLVVQKRREPGPVPGLVRYWTELQCVDYTAILDAHLVLAEYPAQSATTTILDLISRYAAASGISTAGVPANLPSLPGRQIIHERPSTVLRRITNQLGGGFYLDARRTLRVWSSTIPSPIQESVPAPLTDQLATLKSFQMTTDASQQRTRVFVEGTRTETITSVVPNALTFLPGLVPVVDPSVIHLDPGTGPDAGVKLTRLGVQYVRAISTYTPLATETSNPIGSVTTTNVAAGDAIMYVADQQAFPPYGFISAGEQVVPYTKGTGITPLNIPAAGQAGALLAPVSAGTQVTVLPWVSCEGLVRSYHPAQPLRWWETWNPGLWSQPAETPVVLLAVKQNNQEADTIARMEGSSGYYEHLVQDGRFSSEGAIARADAELANFAKPLVSYEWETDDLNAEPGRMQHIAFGFGDGLVTDVRITNVEVRPLVSNQPPRRSVRAAAVQPASVMDVWLDDTR